MDQTEELELIEQYYRKTVAWAPSDEEALSIAQDLLEKAQRGFVVDDTGDRSRCRCARRQLARLATRLL